MSFFDITTSDISNLNDADLRELVGRLCEAEIAKQNLSILCVDWGGAQEAPDGGIDVRVNSKCELKIQGFVPRKNTGFQVKKNSMPKKSCLSEMQKDGQVKPVIAELIDESGAYIIISGKDNCSESMRSSRLQGMKEAIQDVPNNSKLLLDFYGGDKLAQTVRQFPGVALWIRSRLGKPLSGWQVFGRWTSVKKDLDDEYLLSEEPCITDLNTTDKKGLPILEGIELVRNKLRNKKSVVRIIGLSGVGKTRFAQALFEKDIGENALSQSDVIYADLGESLTPSATDCIEYLIVNNISAQVVLDNCPPDTHRALQERISQNNTNIRLLTIEYDIREDQSEGTDVVQIEPVGEKLVSDLVQKRFSKISQLNADKIAEFSGGNARVALALANRVEPDETLTKLSDNELFLRLFQQRHSESESLLEAAELMSLVYSFNINSTEYNDELNTLADIGDLRRRDLHRNQAELLRRQLAQKRGDWRAVLPHAIANKLAVMALQNIAIEDINRVLFKKENFRLFKSCAHRLGYLHDSEEAMNLAFSWLVDEAPFCDLTQCDESYFSVFEYIAPIFPEVALSCIEKAYKQNSEFCSANNLNFINIIRLLRKIAYDSENFDRAAYLILKFVENRGIKQGSDNSIGYFKELFSLYLSGTLASPRQRQKFFRENISFESPSQLKIAEELFDYTFKISGWSSGLGFDFGARARDFGWQPKTHDDQLEWYIGFIEILEPVLSSKDQKLQKWAKSILVKHFNDLWTYVGCSALLTKIIKAQLVDKPWPEMYLVIKNTLHFNGKKFDEDIKEKLQELELLTAPNDLKSQIEHYVLTNSWELWYEYTETGEDEDKRSIRALEIGKQTVYERELLLELIPEFLQNSTDLQIPFGKGLAQESQDKKEFFSFLLEGIIVNQSLARKYYFLLEGFIRGVYEQDTSLARTLQILVLEKPELKGFFIHCLVTCPIDSEVVECLIALAKSGKIRAEDFAIIASDERHGAIMDSDLIRLLEAIQELDFGTQIVIDILNRRFFRLEKTDYQPSEGIIFFSRDVVKNVLALSYADRGKIPHHSVKNIIAVALNRLIKETDIIEVIDVLFRSLQDSFIIDTNSIEVIGVLLKNFPILFLDKVYGEIGGNFFNKAITRRIYISDFVEIETLLTWSNNDQLKIQFLIQNSSVFLLKKTCSFHRFEDGILLPIQLSEHMEKLLDIVTDKKIVFDTIYNQLSPRSWSGSEADIIEERAKVFYSLLEHHSIVVQELAREAIVQSTTYIQNVRKKEAEDVSSREQRFE